MKRVMLMMVLAALLLTQCKKPSIDFPTPSETTTVSMTITAGPGSKTDISTMGVITWSDGDKIYVGDGIKYVGYLTLSGEGGDATGTFTGDVTVATGDDCTFHFYYLGHDNGAAPAADATEATVDFSSQDIHADDRGNLTNASKHHVGYGKVENVPVAAGQPITGLHVRMKSKVAIAYFSFKDGESATPYTGAITLRGDNICNEMTVYFNTNDFDFKGEKGDISLAGGHAERYVMLVPTGSTAEEILNFGGVVTGSTTLANGIEANKFYRVDGSMPIVVPLAHGMVNFGAPNLNWSVCNLGATNGATAESWYGDYYAWGETAPYYQNGSWCEHPSHNPNFNFDEDKGYNLYNYLDGKTSWSYSPPDEWNPAPYDNDSNILNSEHDAATQEWGVGWRMPTKEEWQSLYDNNTFEWLEPDESDETYGTSFTAVAAGCLVVKGGKNSVTLDPTVYMFLPAAGYFDGTSPQYDGSGGYWSRSLYNSTPYSEAYCVAISGDSNYPPYNSARYYGMSVRPVRAAR